MDRTVSVSKQRIKRVFDRTLEQVRAGGKISVSGNMRIEGYSPASAKAMKVTFTRTWQELLAGINDELILSRIGDALLSQDNRAALQAADMLLKLKDKYPASKMKFQAAYEERDRIAGERIIEAEQGEQNRGE